MSDEAETRASLFWARTMSLIQWVCACTWLRNWVGGGLESTTLESAKGSLLSSSSSSSASVLSRSRCRSHAHITPSRPPEYRIEFWGSTAKPLTPSLCPPAELASGSTGEASVATAHAAAADTYRTRYASARCVPCPSISPARTCGRR
ncbi:hypothetical protein IG631_16066 [Alternaria alternata]|nr:hypothetical protein IG631_16066 [Alternaria alternata]